MTDDNGVVMRKMIRVGHRHCCKKFHGVYKKLNEVLDGLMYKELGITKEVQE
ncbi:hypothetical protein Hdeb2414_s0026g00680491 [Helianthus debilis subsp. tardiflorus]